MSKCVSCGSCREEAVTKEKKRVPPPEILCELEERVVRPMRDPPPVPTKARLRVHVRCGATDIEGAEVILAEHDEPARAPIPTGSDGCADCGDLPAGQWDVTVRLTATNHNDERYVVAADPIVVDLVAGVGQDIDVDADPLLRLKLGQQLPNVAAQTWLRVWLPIAVGSGGHGRGHCMWLEFAVPAGQLSYHGDDPHNAQVAVYDAANDRREHDTGTGEWHYFQLLGATASITITLWEQGFARADQHPDSEAVIPWNFYFWSASRLMAAKASTPVAFLDKAAATNVAARSPFQDFDEALTLGNDSFDWERDPANDRHNDLRLSDPALRTWEGHCNWMCIASIIFDEPANHPRLDSESLKLLASEYAANHGVGEQLWTLDAIVEPFDKKMVLHFANGVAGYPLALLDPARTLPASRAAWRGEDEAAIRGALGAVASTFYPIVRRRIGELGQLLVSDLRADYNPDPIKSTASVSEIKDGLKAIGAKSSEVWNQVVFCYRAVYAEHTSSDGHATELRSAQDLRVWLTLFANSDGELPTNHAPARYEDPDIVIEPKHWSRCARLRLQFTAGGDFDPSAAENGWETCTSPDGSTHYFIPRVLDRVVGVADAPHEGGGGNPYVTLERLEALGLVLRNVNG